MDKISSILPSNARIQSVDVDSSPAARPGSPTLGRHEGISSVRDRVSLSDAARSAALKDSFKDTLGGARSKDIARAKMVAEINRNFFENRVKPPTPEVAPPEEVIAPKVDAEEIKAPLEDVADRDAVREAMIAKYIQPEAPAHERPLTQKGESSVHEIAEE